VGEKGDGDQALGKSKGGFSTKLNLRGEGFGKPITWVLTGGQRLEATQVQALMEGGAARRPSGQIRVRPAWVAGDKGYTGRKIRRYLRRGIGTVTPRLRNEPRRGVRFDRAAYRTRNRIERLINRLKQFRAVATRYDKLAVRFHATVNLAAIRLWL
jgi:transposase